MSRRRRYMQEFPNYDNDERELHLVLAVRWLVALLKGKPRGGAKVTRVRPKPLK